ncbi:MAG: hypothetical protein M3065_19665 [Actinomycetota bacterium]|nr:hypothetical protein [Actinomycetota bacterium]
MKRSRLFLATSGLLAASSAAIFAAGGAAASPASTLPTLTLALNGKTVVVGGSTVSGAVNVETTVTGESFASALLFKLGTGVSPSAFAQATQAVGAHHGDLNYLSPYGSIVFSAPAPKGTSTAQTRLAAGTYFAIDANNSNGPPPHALVTVTPSASPAPLPTPGATVSTIEFGFTGPTTLHAGEAVRFVNNGFVMHMDDWLRVKNMANAKLLVKGLQANTSQRKAGKLIIGQGEFASPMSTGGIVQTTITEKPGIYVQACFMNTQDGHVHTALGMERIIKITK